MITKLNKNQIITRNEIDNLLTKARATFNYTRIMLWNGIYIQISFFRDKSIDISTNSRELGLWQQIKELRTSYTQARLADFLFRWVNQQNR